MRQPRDALYSLVESPLGVLLLVGDGTSLTCLYLPDHMGGAPIHGGWRRDDSPFRAAREQLAAYFAGELTTFDLALAPQGTPFQQEVWKALLDVPYGSTTSYGRLAAQIERPLAFRAVGLANGRNPISIVIPCHRVVASNGALIGYGGGVEHKRLLLDLEARHVAARS